MSIYIYVDDIREDDTFFNNTFDQKLWTPVVCRTYEETIKVINEFYQDTYLFLDLDHDLGDYYSDGGDAIKLLDWLAERETFYPVEIHTANPVGRANMERMLTRYWGEGYW